MKVYTIKEERKTEFIEKNSKFITILYKVEKEEDIKTCLIKTKEEYKKATHYCYAYRLKGKEGASDDREPAKTAGTPMLQVLQKQDIINVLAVTVRYFGGIKLGPGGLIRAYTKGVQDTLKECSLIPLQLGCLIQVEFPYEKEKEIKYLFSNNTIRVKVYSDQCSYFIEIPKQQLEKIKIPFTILEKDILIEEKDSK